LVSLTCAARKPAPKFRQGRELADEPPGNRDSQNAAEILGLLLRDGYPTEEVLRRAGQLGRPAKPKSRRASARRLFSRSPAYRLYAPKSYSSSGIASPVVWPNA
jgi:hypothetical protein